MSEETATFDKKLSPEEKAAVEVSPADKALMSDIEKEQHGPQYYDHVGPNNPNGPHTAGKTDPPANRVPDKLRK